MFFCDLQVDLIHMRVGRRAFLCLTLCFFSFLPLLNATQTSSAGEQYASLCNLEATVGKALENGDYAHQGLRELDELNEYYLRQLFGRLSQCRGATPADLQAIEKVGEMFSYLFEYELYFEGIAQGVFPFRSPISHLACKIVQNAGVNNIEEIIDAFLSTQASIQTTFVMVNQQCDLTRDSMKRFIVDLKAIARQGGFSAPDRVIKLRCTQREHAQRVHTNERHSPPRPPQASHSRPRRGERIGIPQLMQSRLGQAAMMHRPQQSPRRALGRAGRWGLGILALLGGGWAANRYIARPLINRVRRYRDLARMAEQILPRLQGLEVNEAVQECVKATAELPPEEQRQFLETALSLMKERGMMGDDLDKSEALSQIIAAVAPLPEEQQTSLLRAAMQAFGFDAENIEEGDRNEVIEIVFQQVVDLEQEPQARLLRSVKEAFEINVEQEGNNNEMIGMLFDRVAGLGQEPQALLLQNVKEIFEINVEQEGNNNEMIGMLFDRVAGLGQEPQALLLQNVKEIFEINVEQEGNNNEMIGMLFDRVAGLGQEPQALLLQNVKEIFGVSFGGGEQENKEQFVRIAFDQLVSLDADRQRIFLENLRSVFGGNDGNGLGKDTFEAIYGRAIRLPQEQQEQLIRTLMHVLGFDDPDAQVFDGMTIQQLRERIEMVIPWAGFFQVARSFLKGEMTAEDFEEYDDELSDFEYSDSDEEEEQPQDRGVVFYETDDDSDAEMTDDGEMTDDEMSDDDEGYESCSRFDASGDRPVLTQEEFLNNQAPDDDELSDFEDSDFEEDEGVQENDEAQIGPVRRYIINPIGNFVGGLIGGNQPQEAIAAED